MHAPCASQARACVHSAKHVTFEAPTRYLSSPAAATLHRKTQGFVLRFPPQNQPRATFMQPLQCVSQRHVANPHLSTHMAAEHVTTIMQPIQCDPQPEIQETHRTTQAGTTTCCRTQRRNQFAHETTAAATAAHTRYLASPAAATLHGKHKVSCSGFLTNTSPMQHSCRSVLHQGQFFCDVLLCDVKFHTALHQGQFFCDVLLRDVATHTTLHQGQVSQFYLSVTRKYCFPTSFDYP